MNHFTYDEITTGQEVSFSRSVTEEMMEAFRAISGDENPLHSDQDYATEAGYPGRVVYGMLSASLLSTLAGVYLPGEFSLIQTADLEFVKPVYIGDTLTVTGVVTDKYDEFRAIKLKVTVRNQCGSKVCRAKMRIGVQR